MFFDSIGIDTPSQSVGFYKKKKNSSGVIPGEKNNLSKKKIPGGKDKGWLFDGLAPNYI